MPKLVSPGLNQPALATAAGAHHYRLLGIEFAKKDSTAMVGDMVRLGDGSSAQNSLSQVPHDLAIDRCYIHSTTDGELKRGIALNSASTTVTNCCITEVKGAGYDTQAICGWNGPGPYTITNNYLEAAGETVMFGGADPSIPGLVPSDIALTGNTITKQLQWRGKWTVKNLLELKNAQRVLIQGNLLENNWGDAQVGFAVLFKSVNQDGTAPWSVTQNVTFTNNIVRHSASAVALRGIDPSQPGQVANHITITNNLFDDINGATWGGDGTFLMISNTPMVNISRNTVMQTGTAILASELPSQGFAFTDNLLPCSGYGVKGDSVGSGTATLNAYFPGCEWAENLVIGANPQLYPAGNYYPATMAAVGFVDYAVGNYVLSSGSPYCRAASDGTDIGCNFQPLTSVLSLN